MESQMLSSTNSSQNTPEIRAHIEELATELVVRDPASISTDEFTTKLADIAQRASAAGRADAAEIATSLAQLIDTEGIGEGEAISRGLVRLQEAISVLDAAGPVHGVTALIVARHSTPTALASLARAA